MRKYTNPQAHGYLMEAKACDKVIQELKRIENKLQRATDKEGSARQAEFEKVMEYTNEVQIQDDYGWDLITEAQFERYMELFRDGQAALENHAPTVTEIALLLVRRIISDIAADKCEWEFSALTPEQQQAEIERAEKSRQAWKQKITEIRKRRDAGWEHSNDNET